MDAQEIFQKTMGPPRKRMTSFRLDEISAVDRPAQEGAVATILKAAGPTPTPLSFATFEEAVSFLAKSSTSRLDAYRKAGSMFPHLVARLNAEAPPRPTRTMTKADDAMHQLTLEQQAILSRSPGMSRTAALTMARKARPDLIDALR